MAIYIPEPIEPFHDAVGASFGSFTARQDVSPTPLPVIPAGKFRLGLKIKVEAQGEFSTTGTPNLTMGLYIGTVAGAITTVLAESSVIVTGSGAAAWPWRMEWEAVVTALGTSGQVVGTGTLFLGTALTTYSIVPIPITAALRTVTWDTTIARALGVCATWGTSSASNTVKTLNHAVSILN